MQLDAPGPHLPIKIEKNEKMQYLTNLLTNFDGSFLVMYIDLPDTTGPKIFKL